MNAKRLILAACVIVSLFLIYFFAQRDTAIFTLPERQYSILVEPSGNAVVTETVTWKLLKPFRYVSWNLELQNPMKISDFTFQVLEGPSLEGGPFYASKTANKIELRLMFSPTMNTYVDVPDEGLIVKVAFAYHVKNMLIEGRDFTQLYVKYIGENTPVRTEKLVAKVVLPDEFGPPEIYHHPWGLYFTKKNIIGNMYEIAFSNVPKNTFVEGRFVFPNLIGTGTEFLRKDVTYEDVIKEERSYKNKSLFINLASGAYLLLVIIVPILIYRKLGREEKIDYGAEYEREVPSNDAPEEVNAIVKNICSLPDDDAISAAILDMLKRKEIELLKDEKGRIKGMKIAKTKTSRNLLLKAFLPFSENGEIDFKTTKKMLKKQRYAKQFVSDINGWKKHVWLEVKKRKYLNAKGNILAKLFSTIFGIAIPVLIIFSTRVWIESGLSVVASYTTIEMMGCIAVGAVVLLMRKDVFSKWSKEGLLYYLRWKSFERFLNDFSALSEYPPESVAIWDDYIVYATALGCAKKVVSSLKKLHPTPPETPVAGSVYSYPLFITEISSLPKVAVSTTSSSQSSHSFTGGSGIGGGVGGSNVGAG